MKNFAHRIRQIRESFSVSQRGLARALDIPKYYVSKWEHANYIPSGGIRGKIAECFGVTPSWLDGREPYAFSGVVFVPRFFMAIQNISAISKQKKLIGFILASGGKLTGTVISTAGPPRRYDDLSKGRGVTSFPPVHVAFRHY